MKKEIEATHEITSQEIDALHSAQSKLREENRSFRDQLKLKENNEISPLLLPMNDLSPKIISAGDAETVSLPITAPILASSLLSPLITYTILTLLLLAIIWIVGKKIWNIWKKSDQIFTYENYINRNHAKCLSARPDHYYFQS